jgi:hypothetical protein
VQKSTVLLVQAMSASLNTRKAVDILLKWLGRTSDYSETATFKHPDFRGCWGHRPRKNVTHVQTEVPCNASERLIIFWQHGKKLRCKRRVTSRGSFVYKSFQVSCFQ